MDINYSKVEVKANEMTDEEKVQVSSILLGIPRDAIRRMMNHDAEMKEEGRFDWDDTVYYIP